MDLGAKSIQSRFLKDFPLNPCFCTRVSRVLEFFTCFESWMSGEREIYNSIIWRRAVVMKSEGWFVFAQSGFRRSALAKIPRALRFGSGWM